MFSEPTPGRSRSGISAVSKFLDDRGFVGVMRFSGQTGAPDRAGGPGSNFLKYKLPDNVLYVNSSLTRPYFETKKAKAQRERLVGLAPGGQRRRSELLTDDPTNFGRSFGSRKHPEPDREEKEPIPIARYRRC
jgi:hypothetical protein